MSGLIATVVKWRGGPFLAEAAGRQRVYDVSGYARVGFVIAVACMCCNRGGGLPVDAVAVG